MDINRQREELKKAYPNSIYWHEKVDRMPENQVNAIYIRLQSEGKLGK